MANSDVSITLEEGVDEILSQLSGLDLTYDPSMDRWHVVARAINRALRFVALEHEWSCYSDTEDMGVMTAGTQAVELSSRQRARIIGDDAMRLVNSDDAPVVWIFILPRDALSKHYDRPGLWASITRTTISFSRPISTMEAGLTLQVPVMREPKLFSIPSSGESPTPATLAQLIDFDYPDLVIARAAYMYAQSDPVLQPRVQTLEAQYKDMMYQLVERDDRHTDSTYQNDFFVPIQNSVRGPSVFEHAHQHPHSDARWM